MTAIRQEAIQMLEKIPEDKPGRTDRAGTECR